ncbi:MAG TPA: hypothetical protein VFF40_00650 [Acidimicrobiia bacterium]|nr:hypothetical protein [Acidimicrobiia bacterium]
MSRRPFVAILVVAVGAAFSSVAAAPHAQPTKTVSAKQWAKAFWGTVADWVEAATAGSEELDVTIGTEDDAVAIRAALVSYIDDVSDQTSTTIKKLKRAGDPDVKNGKKNAKKIAKTLRNGFVEIRDTLDDASVVAGDMPIDSVSGADAAAQEAQDVIQEGFGAFDDALGKVKRLDKGGLNKVMAKTSACQRLGN